MASQIQWAASATAVQTDGGYNGVPANLTAVDGVRYEGYSYYDHGLTMAVTLSLSGFSIPSDATITGIALVKGGDYGHLKYRSLTGDFSLPGGGSPDRELTDGGNGYGLNLGFPWGGPTDLWERTSITPAAVNAGFDFVLELEDGVYYTDCFGFDALGVQVWYDVVEASDAAHSTAVVPGGVIGAATVITVQAKTADGVDRGSGGDTVVVAVTGANEATPTVTDHSDGTYTASYVPTTAGDDAVAITLGGTAISGSPYTSTVVASGAELTTVNEMSAGWS